MSELRLAHSIEAENGRFYRISPRMRNQFVLMVNGVDGECFSSTRDAMNAARDDLRTLSDVSQNDLNRIQNISEWTEAMVVVEEPGENS